MMKYRVLNNGDYSFGQGTRDFYTSTNAVSQSIKTRLLLLSGEWWEDTGDGLPLFESILGVSGTPDNLNAIDLIIQERITSTPHVISLKSFSSSRLARQYSFVAEVETEYGDAEVSITL